MPHRYQAPEHTSSISAPTRDIQVGEDGIVELPDDAPDVEHDYLRRAGCRLLPDESPQAGAVALPEAEGSSERQDAAETLSEPEIGPVDDISAKAKSKT